MWTRANRICRLITLCCEHFFHTLVGDDFLLYLFVVVVVFLICAPKLAWLVFVWVVRLHFASDIWKEWEAPHERKQMAFASLNIRRILMHTLGSYSPASPFHTTHMRCDRFESEEHMLLHPLFRYSEKKFTYWKSVNSCCCYYCSFHLVSSLGFCWFNIFLSTRTWHLYLLTLPSAVAIAAVEYRLSCAWRVFNWI